MNRIWSSIIIFSFIYAIMTNNLADLINNILMVPQETLSLLLTIGGLIIIYNGIFQMAIEAKVVEKTSFFFKPLIKWIFKDVQDQELINIICANVTANLLGLGLATTPMALEALKKMKDHTGKAELSKEMILLVVLNVSAFTIFPLTVITLREKYNSDLGIKVWGCIVILTFLVSLISILITRWKTNDIHN